MSEPIPSRRRFLSHAVVAAAAVPFARALLVRPAHAADLPALPADNTTAVALAYLEDGARSPHPSHQAGRLCANCQFYTGAAGAARGPCTLFPGFSVAAAGWCSAWATKP